MTRPMISDPFGGRSLEEWIGSSPDAKVPDRVRDRILARARNVCHISGQMIRGKPWQLEHVKPLSMGGEHRETNLRPALVDAHKVKSAEEAQERAKADRIRRKHNGTYPKSKTPIRSRGFAATRGDAR